jgi:O-acetyl-ADP-ribose deacetylase (regulator of RNase III)
MALEVIIGDLLQAKEKVICHQCNCLSKKAAHLAYSVFEAFPWANVYSDRDTPSKPGDIFVSNNPGKGPHIIALFAQVYPGKPNYPFSTKDGSKAREKYFSQALEKLGFISRLYDSFAFPYGIGCGAAGGHWPTYQAMLEQFAKDNPTKKIVLYKLEKRS